MQAFLANLLGQTDTSAPDPLRFGDINFPLPGEAPNPRLKPPTENIKKDISAIFAGNTTLPEKAGAVGDTLVQLLGLPQEAATRALTGGQYALPSDVPALKNMIANQPEFSGMLANIALDPLNLVGVPIFGKLMKGELLGQQLYTKFQNFNELRLTKDYSFNRVEDMEKLFQKAGVAPPIVNYGDFHTVDWANVPNPTALRARLDEAKKTFKTRDLLEIDPNTGKYHYPKGAKTSGEGLKSADRIGPIGQFLASPDKLSETTELATTMVNDAHYGFSRYMNDINERIVGSLPDQVIDNPSSPLARAFVYKLRGIEVDLFKKDPEAMKAMNSFGLQSFNTAVAKVEGIQRSTLSRIPLETTKINPADPDSARVYIGELVKEAYQKGIDIPLTSEMRNNFSDKTVLNPNHANIQDYLQFFFHYVGKKGIKEPVFKAVENMIGYFPAGAKERVQGTHGHIGTDEFEYITTLLGNARGYRDKLDKQTADWLLQSTTKDFVRDVAWGRKLSARAKAEESLNEIPGLRGFMGRQAEKLLGSAEKKEYIVQQAVAKGRNQLYMGLLGGNIGSAIKNTTQLINTMADVGVGKTLQGIGAMFNPEWRKYLQDSKIIQRTSSSLAELFENTPWNTGKAKEVIDPVTGAVKREWVEKKSMMDVIMSPFQFTENFTRGATFTAIVNDLSKKMPLGDALIQAERHTKDLMFGYSMTDMSPYVKNPVIKPFFQFMTYPMKQTELLLRFAKGDYTAIKAKGIGSIKDAKTVRYLALMGGAITYGAHLGLDVKDAFLMGLFPAQAGQAPLYTAAEKATTLAKEAMQQVFNPTPEAEDRSPSLWWKGLGEFLKMTVPTGLYSSKIIKNAVEDKDFIDKLFSTDFDVRATLAKHPWMQGPATALGINPDPGINWADRVARMAGFKSVHETNRRDFMLFLTNFSKRYREAIGDLNETAAMDGDVDAVRAKWIRYMDKHFKDKMSRFGVKDYSMYDTLEPTITDKQKEALKESFNQSNVNRVLKPLPKAVRGEINFGGM